MTVCVPRLETRRRVVSRNRRWVLAGALVLCSVQAFAQAPDAVAMNAEKKLDVLLRRQLLEASDGQRTKVIISARKGTRVALREMLTAAGATLGTEYTVIEALSAEVPVSALRDIAKEESVVAISSDGDITSRATPARP
jgi:hypothetical protein